MSPGLEEPLVNGSLVRDGLEPRLKHPGLGVADVNARALSGDEESLETQGVGRLELERGDLTGRETRRKGESSSGNVEAGGEVVNHTPSVDNAVEQTRGVELEEL